MKDYVCIHTKDKDSTLKKIVTLQTMKSLESQLSENQFIRVHNSYIIAFDAIDAIDKEKIQIGKNFIPISDTYRKAFKEFIEKTGELINVFCNKTITGCTRKWDLTKS